MSLHDSMEKSFDELSEALTSPMAKSIINKWATGASSYWVVPGIIFYRTDKGRWRVRPISDIATRGIFEHGLQDLHPCPHIAVRNQALPNEAGRRPAIPAAFLEACLQVGYVCLRGKHLIAKKGVDGNESPFDLMSRTFTTFKGGVGYMPSMFAAVQAGMWWSSVEFVVDFVRGADGKPCGSDGGGLFVVDDGSLVHHALKTNSGQVRIYEHVKSFFGKGMISPILRSDVDRLYPHLKGMQFSLIVDPSQFKAGKQVELGSTHPLVAKGLDSSYSSYKDFFVAASAAGITDLRGTAAVGVMSVKKQGRASLSAGAILRLEKSGFPLASGLMEKSFSNWQRSGGVRGTINGLVQKEIDTGVAEMRNVVLAHDLMNEMMSESGNPVFFDPMGVKAVRDQVLDNVGRKFHRFYTGLGVKGKSYPARIDNTVPPGVFIVHSSSGYSHNQKVVVWREPIVSTTGIFVMTAWVLDDPNCPEEIREKYCYLRICREFIASELDIVYRFQGDNDGDMFSTSGNPKLVELYENHAFHVFEKGEMFLIEGGETRGRRAKAPIQDSLVGLGLDYRGPIGPETRAQQAGFAVANKHVVVGFLRAMQTAVDQQKNDLRNPDYRADADLRTWSKVPIPGWPEFSAWSPSSAYLSSDMEDQRGYPDIGKMMKWLKKKIGMNMGDAMPWLEGKKFTLDKVKRGPLVELSIVDMLYNRFLKILEESGIDLTANGEIIFGKHLLDLIKWKSGREFEVSSVGPKSAYYLKLLEMSGLRAFASKKAQVMKQIRVKSQDEAKDRSMQISSAKEALLCELQKLTIEQRLTIWLTECEQAVAKGVSGDGAPHLKKAYRAVFLGENEITNLLGFDSVEGCTFMRDNSQQLLARVKHTMECPKELLGLHRFSGAAAALLNGFEFQLTNGEPMMRSEADTLNSMHEEETGAKLIDCSVCVSRAQKLLVNQYRWSPKGERGEYAVNLVRELNAVLSTDEMQNKINAELAPHYEDKFKK